MVISLEKLLEKRLFSSIIDICEVIEVIIDRNEYLEQIGAYKDKDLVKVLTGIRRCGKSFLLFELYFNYLISQGIDEEHIIKINLESNLQKQLRNATRLFKFVQKQIKDKEKYYLFIDEIQTIDNFEDVVNGIRVDFNIDIYLTGSNSKLLSSDINTKLRGRSIEIKVYPLSFEEFLRSSSKDQIGAFNEYLLYGGLPYLLSSSNEKDKVEYLQMINSTVIIKDIIERYRIQNENVFNAVFEFLCSNIGSYVSAHKIVNTLKSNGYQSITDDTVGNYLEHLVNAYLFYKVQRYDIKGKAYLKTLNKYYICDLGLRNSKLNYRQVEITHSLENVIYLELLRRGYMVDIGKNHEKEIDFIARGKDDTYYIQVAYTLTDEKKKEQEIGSFKKIDDGYKKIIVTMDIDPFKVIDDGYKKINLFDFLLDSHALEKI